LAALQPPAVHAAGSDIVKVALIGCGGRGTGAAQNALNADKRNKLVALADSFKDQLERSRQTLKDSHTEQYDVTDDRCFVGFDAYKQIMQTDADVVCLCTPPHFRPAHLRAAIEANKHVFCEKPVAVDATGVRHVLETTEMAKQKNLNIVSGLCWRYDHGVRATADQIKNGAIGPIIAMHANYLTGTLWQRQRQPGWSDMEYQMRNWLYYTWLSGDHNNEQHIHTLDKMLWLMGDEAPVSCVAMGGRQVRVEPQWGNVYDHFAAVYEWANGVKGFAYCRQMGGCYSNNECYVLGTKGRASMLAHAVDGETKWNYEGKNKKPSMYDVEHVELFQAIRNGKPINNGVYMSRATLMAVMARQSAYTGQRVTWEQALQSKEDLTPKAYQWGPVDMPEVAQPGKTKLV
jgi:predicted dehydrogenase